MNYKPDHPFRQSLPVLFAHSKHKATWAILTFRAQLNLDPRVAPGLTLQLLQLSWGHLPPAKGMQRPADPVSCHTTAQYTSEFLFREWQLFSVLRGDWHPSCEASRAGLDSRDAALVLHEQLGKRGTYPHTKLCCRNYLSKLNSALSTEIYLELFS